MEINVFFGSISQVSTRPSLLQYLGSSSDTTLKYVIRYVLSQEICKSRKTTNGVFFAASDRNLAAFLVVTSSSMFSFSSLDSISNFYVRYLCACRI